MKFVSDFAGTKVVVVTLERTFEGYFGASASVDAVTVLLLDAPDAPRSSGLVIDVASIVEVRSASRSNGSSE